MSGRVMVIGLGPGPAKWLTPEASELLAGATDIIGYGPYVERVPASGPHAAMRATTASKSTARAMHGMLGSRWRQGFGRGLGRRSRRVRDGRGDLRGG